MRDRHPPAVPCCSSDDIDASAPVSARRDQLARALRLEYLTVGWNVVEGAVAIAAGLAAGSVALVGFGLDSVVETTSGAILIWRLRAEAGGKHADSVESLDRRARRLVALSLALLALYIACDASWSLWRSERPGGSPVGIAVTGISLAVMWWLARAKRSAARALNSEALAADAVQTSACWWLSLSALVGLSLNALFGWWWADPVAALAMSVLLVVEARGAWQGEDTCCR